LQSLGDVIRIYALSNLIYGKKVVAVLAFVSLFVGDDSALNKAIGLAFGAFYIIHGGMYSI
jgi:hypothetical protein